MVVHIQVQMRQVCVLLQTVSGALAAVIIVMVAAEYAEARQRGPAAHLC